MPKRRCRRPIVCYISTHVYIANVIKRDAARFESVSHIKINYRIQVTVKVRILYLNLFSLFDIKHGPRSPGKSCRRKSWKFCACDDLLKLWQIYFTLKIVKQTKPFKTYSIYDHEQSCKLPMLQSFYLYFIFLFLRYFCFIAEKPFFGFLLWFSFPNSYYVI